MQTQIDNQLLTTNGILLDSEGFETATNVWARIQDGLLVVDSTPHAIWDVRVYPDRITSKASGWTLLL